MSIFNKISQLWHKPAPLPTANFAAETVAQDSAQVGSVAQKESPMNPVDLSDLVATQATADNALAQAAFARGVAYATPAPGTGAPQTVSTAQEQIDIANAVKMQADADAATLKAAQDTAAAQFAALQKQFDDLKAKDSQDESLITSLQASLTAAQASINAVIALFPVATPVTPAPTNDAQTSATPVTPATSAPSPSPSV